MCLDPISRIGQSWDPVGNKLGIAQPTDKLIGQFSPINTNDPLTKSMLKKPPAAPDPRNGYGLTITRGTQ